MKSRLKTIATLLIITLTILGTNCSKSIEKQFEELEASQESHLDPIIFAAIQSGRPELVEFALKNRNAKLEITNFSGNTPLLAAAEVGDVPIMKLLVAAGANLKVSNIARASLVHVVAEKGHVEAMMFLMECGIDINERNLSGSSTVINGTLVFDPQLDRAIRSTGRNPADGEQPIHVAARRGNVEMVKFLIASGVDPDSKDENGKSPLDYVNMEGLVEKGAEPRGNRLAVVRIYNPDQQETPPSQRSHVPTEAEIQRRFFSK
jgi:hypothetical protein